MPTQRDNLSACSGPSCQRIAIVGSGPRGLSVLERLSARLAAGEAENWKHIHLFLIDAVEVGGGRIWRSGQPPWFLMNTVAGEISAYSGPPDGGPTRPGAGPSFAQWWEAAEPGNGRANDCAPRALYGRYLSELLDAAERSLPDNTTLWRVEGRVYELGRAGCGYRLAFADGRRLQVDRAVLVTGHSAPRLSGNPRRLRSFSDSHPRLRYIAGDSAADMALDDIATGNTVGVIGMGLTFYDVMAALTVGRGGAFYESGTGLQYEPSGREPLLVAGSRSGMPQPARGRNQKGPHYVYRPVFFRPELVRRDAPGHKIDFRRDILPRLMAEVNFVYLSTALRERSGAQAGAAFERTIRATAGTSVAALRWWADRFGLESAAPPDFDAMSLPFAGATFDDVPAWQAALTQAVEADVHEAERGNCDSPVKAALDVLRGLRGAIRDLVDFGGVTARSHEEDLVLWYSPRSAFLAAGPPLLRLRQVLALMRVGVLRVIGPQAQYATDDRSGRYVLSSPAVHQSRVLADTIVDARIPPPDLPSDSSPLAQQLHGTGVWTEFVNSDPTHRFATGGVAVSRSPFHPIGRDGDPDRGLHVLGIPSEHTRWFTQVVATGPGCWSEFMQDADDVASALLKPLTTKGICADVAPQIFPRSGRHEVTHCPRRPTP